MIEKARQKKFTDHLTEKSKEKFCISSPDKNAFNNFTLSNDYLICYNTSLSYLKKIGILTINQDKEIIETINVIKFFEIILREKELNTEIENIKISAYFIDNDKTYNSFKIRHIRIECKDIIVNLLQDDQHVGLDRLGVYENKIEIIFCTTEIKNTRELLLLRYLNDLYNSYGISKDMITIKNLPQIRQLIEIMKV